MNTNINTKWAGEQEGKYKVVNPHILKLHKE